jgi:hypothetical protein
MSSPVQAIGMTLVFCRLVCRPVTKPKFSRMDFKLLTSGIDGFKKMTASSAYKEALNLAALPFSLVSNPLSVAI